MKPDEAIELLKNMKWSITTKFNAVNNSTKALDMAITALEKQNPREPNGDFVKILNRFVHMCPICGARVADHVLFCHECGQALLWEE